MKKILAIAIAVVMTVALFAVTSTAADAKCLITAEQLSAETNTTKSGVSFELKEEGGEKFARFTAVDLDPHLYLSPDVTTDVANHFAVIKYRTTSEAATIDAYMAGAEPHTVFTNIENDGNWHMCYGDLEQSGANWTGKFSRLDPLNNGSLKEGDTIDIAWIALFASEDDAKAYTGPAAGETPVAPEPEKSADQWLGGSEPAGHSTGWWMNPIAEGCDKYIKIGFTAAGNFSGIHGYYLCNPTTSNEGPTVVKAQILKGDTVLAEKEIPVDGDAWYDTDFGKTIPAGDYTLSFLPVSGNGGWFVLGSYDGQGDWTIDTNCATNDATKTHPEIMLIGAAAAADPQPSNPGTADASVIAIAAVACVALAGVVVAKKIR